MTGPMSSCNQWQMAHGRSWRCVQPLLQTAPLALAVVQALEAVLAAVYVTDPHYVCMVAFETIWMFCMS